MDPGQLSPWLVMPLEDFRGALNRSVINCMNQTISYHSADDARYHAGSTMDAKCKIDNINGD